MQDVDENIPDSERIEIIDYALLLSDDLMILVWNSQ